MPGRSPPGARLRAGRRLRHDPTFPHRAGATSSTAGALTRGRWRPVRVGGGRGPRPRAGDVDQGRPVGRRGRGNPDTPSGPGTRPTPATSSTAAGWIGLDRVGSQTADVGWMLVGCWLSAPRRSTAAGWRREPGSQGGYLRRLFRSERGLSEPLPRPAPGPRSPVGPELPDGGDRRPGPRSAGGARNFGWRSKLRRIAADRGVVGTLPAGRRQGGRGNLTHRQGRAPVRRRRPRARA